MTPLEQLEEGIRNKDWSLIHKGFEGMTGRNIPSEVVEEDMSFSRMLEAHDEEDYKILEPFRAEKPFHAPIKTDSSVTKREQKNKEVAKRFGGEDKKYCKKSQIDLTKSKINLFVDDGTEKKEDTEIQKKIKWNPTKRESKFKLSSVTCIHCGKSYEVNPIFARENYRCDRCILGRK